MKAKQHFILKFWIESSINCCLDKIINICKLTIGIAIGDILAFLKGLKRTGLKSHTLSLFDLVFTCALKGFAAWVCFSSIKKSFLLMTHFRISNEISSERGFRGRKCKLSCYSRPKRIRAEKSSRQSGVENSHSHFSA